MKIRPPLPHLQRPDVRTHNNPLMHTLGRGLRTASKLMLAFFDDGQFHERTFEIKHFQIKLPDLPNEFIGYRILQISDIHLGNWMNPTRLEGVISLVNRQQADLVCITGDFITHVMPNIEEQLVRSLKQLYAPDGVYAVFGNHDYWSDPDLVARSLAQSGIQLLRNEVVRIIRDSGSLVVAGLDDYYNAHDDLDQVAAQLQPADTTVLLVHVPDYADIAAASGLFDLQLSGHSHGGQIVIPGLGTPVLPPLGRKYSRGLYHINGMVHYTNCGVGTATLPVRWNCPPEIVIFELRSPESSR